ncbi:hypothetical protein [Puniceibacterium confluentis]|uniref:hypothetical protein n=1 Tax=Puniceibacterium confluentis TaxID=1958944 RepID=UPI0011B82293|nr:hypothetical protein [Puniceibacterium confluentis]
MAANATTAPHETLPPGQMAALGEVIQSVQPTELETVTDGPLQDWLAQNRDPGLWHELADGLDCSSAENLDVLAWMLAQSDCENAVAVRIFVTAALHELCAVSEPLPVAHGGPVLSHLIAHRESTGGFPSERLSDAQGLDRADLLRRCKAANHRLQDAGRRPFLQAPDRMLGARPSGPLPYTDYVIEAGRILRPRRKS